MLRPWLLLSLAMAGVLAPAQMQPGVPKTAPPGCPWLTQGTAAHALGGDVKADVTLANTSEGACRFSREQGSSDYLEIRVSKSALPACPEKSRELKGIGNDASRCVPPGAHGHDIEMISSRVRDMNFDVALGARLQKGDDPQNDALEQIAEEVAGSLY